MTTTTTTTIIKDRNEVKFLTAVGFNCIPVPRNALSVDFEFEATPELDEARRAYALNRPVPVLSFVGASRYVDGLIAEHRQRNIVGRRHAE